MEANDLITSENQKEVKEQILESVQESVDEEVQEKTSDSTSEKDWFKIVKDAVFGFFYGLAGVILTLTMFLGFFYLLWEGYDRCFNTDGLIEVGERGYCYDPINECFVKPMPNRRVGKGCSDIYYGPGDTIGVVRVGENEYRYINFNTLSFIDDKKYFRADVFRNGVAIALRYDTLYHISAAGRIISSEPSTWIYDSVEEILYIKEEIDIDADIVYKEIATGVFMYKDINGYYGLMSSDFKRLTPAHFSDITAKSKDVFFCEYFESGMGCLIDKNGNYIK